jgi:alpha-glucosidase
MSAINSMSDNDKNNMVWWQGAVIYQIYPRSFCDSTGNGVGDLAGITSKLDYVASLGVDGIWISPFFKSPMHDFGYDVADFRDVDPIFGTLDDFDALLAKAHSVGLKVIIDQVYSHSSIENVWFKESKKDRDNDKADWFVWADASPDGSPPNNWQSVFTGSAWTWNASRQQYYLHNFLPEQPDLNLHNPDVQAELLDIAKFWLERGVDGFRLDAVNFYMHDPDLRDNPVLQNPAATRPFDMQDQLYNQSHGDITAFLKRVRTLMDTYGGRFTVAEVGGRRSIQEMAQYTAGNDLLNTAYSFIFLEEPELTGAAIKGALGAWDNESKAWPSWTFSNHDRQRVVSRWLKGQNPVAFAKQMNALLFSLRGSAFLYQGEELGLPEAKIPFEKLVDPEAKRNWPKTQGRDGSRSPIPWLGSDANGGWNVDSWLPIDPSHYDLSQDAQEDDANSVLNFVRAFLALRKKHPALTRGSINFLECDEPILAFTREFDGEKLLCVFNLGTSEAHWKAPSDSSELIIGFAGVSNPTSCNLPVCGGFIARP